MLLASLLLMSISRCDEKIIMAVAIMMTMMMTVMIR